LAVAFMFKNEEGKTVVVKLGSTLGSGVGVDAVNGPVN